VNKNADLWIPVVTILLHVLVLVMAQGVVFAAIFHLYLHCSPAMALWTFLAVVTLVIYAGGYRVVAYLWTIGRD
jgi:hypothetical protein